MHGHEFNFGAHNPTNWWISEKFDGVRAIWNKDKFISKNGSDINKSKKLMFLGKIIPVPNFFKDMMPVGVILDGELWYENKKGNFSIIQDGI